MGKLIKILVLLAVVAVAGYFAVSYMSAEAEKAGSAAQDGAGVPVEEKYGSTTETVEP